VLRSDRGNSLKDNFHLVRRIFAKSGGFLDSYGAGAGAGAGAGINTSISPKHFTT